MLRLVREARHSILLGSFLLNDGPESREILDALAERAREGLEVRVIGDGGFSFRTASSNGITGSSGSSMERRSFSAGRTSATAVSSRRNGAETAISWSGSSRRLRRVF
jgi:phosphatidylserine/phosphatidylglycerophosphate/cardiolipin synthase-like enzyme